MQPPVLGDNGQGKFVAYGGPDFTVDTELKCRIIAIKGSTLFVAPYENYKYLLLEGNRRKPVPNEDGYVRYRDDILSQGSPPPPIMKLETYGVGKRPDSSDGSNTPPTVKDNTQMRSVRIGDHIRISGLYVIDYAHTMYADLHTDPSFTYMRGPYKIAYAHSEIHPYNFQGLELISDLQPSPALFTEAHTVVAPIFPQVYSFTYAANKVLHAAGQLVADAKQENNTASFFISAPPKPQGNFVPRLMQTEIRQTGEGTAGITHKLVGDTGANVTVSVRGVDVLNPIVYRARYAVAWIPAASVVEITRRCAEIKAQIQKIHGQISQLEQQKAGLNPKDRVDAAEIRAIVQQIEPLQSQIYKLNSEAQALGCNP